MEIPATTTLAPGSGVPLFPSTTRPCRRPVDCAPVDWAKPAGGARATIPTARRRSETLLTNRARNGRCEQGLALQRGITVCAAYGWNRANENTTGAPTDPYRVLRGTPYLRARRTPEHFDKTGQGPALGMIPVAYDDTDIRL